MIGDELGPGPLPIEDYGLIGDCRTAALVGRNGSIDWLCWPRFDSAACFASLLGTANHGQWIITPADEAVKVSRAYHTDTMILETSFETASGAFSVIDFMPVGTPNSTIVRIVRGIRGAVPVHMNLRLRFDYGSTIPWVKRLAGGNGIVAVAGPNLAVLRSGAELHGEGLSTTSNIVVGAGDKIPFVLSYGPSHRAPPKPVDPGAELERTETFWRTWASHCTYTGDRRDALMRSLLTLKALTFTETGGIVAAPTTSLPEDFGGPRNWDYRYCWIRDATLTLSAFMGGGYYDEAKAWRDWLHRALAGTPQDMQIMYGIAGEKRLSEWEVPWLPGYLNSSPVRVGNAASSQLQLDVWGEMMDALHLAREGGLAAWPSGWHLQCKALEQLEKIWKQPDDGIWEVRGGRRHFTHSKVMAWVAFDRSLRDAEKYKLDAPFERWRQIRDEIHETVCERGFDNEKQSFTQSFGSTELDASLLIMPQVGFLPIDDHRVAGTIAAIERELLQDGFVLRYRTESGADGLPPGEGVFLPCSFWLVDVYQRQGRVAEADRLLDRLLSLRNDLGLMSEEYDTRRNCQAGNFPQAFSHLAIVQTIIGLARKVPLRDQLEASVS